MAVYKIFPVADATIYSQYPYKNTGRDEVVEVTVTQSLVTNQDVRRALVRFSNEDLAILKTYTTGSWKTNLRLSLAFAQNLNTDYTLEIYPVSQSWEMGTGKFGDVPQTTNGASWVYTGDYQNSPTWSATQYYNVTGGGSWNTNYSATQSFNYMSDKDINVNVTPIVNAWFSSSISNYGFIVKHPQAIEQSTGSIKELKYFSVDTHTIYPPVLEIKWNDTIYSPNTGSISTITNDQFSINVTNNAGSFDQSSVYKFRLGVRDTYPARVFTTASLYTTNKYLPSNSQWAIQDYKTKEMIVDFDSTYTNISADSTSNYFTVYMRGLEVERYYRILIRTNISGEVVVKDSDMIFKVVS